MSMTSPPSPPRTGKSPSATVFFEVIEREIDPVRHDCNLALLAVGYGYTDCSYEALVLEGGERRSPEPVVSLPGPL
jgi:hypothetical protein